MTSTHHYKWLKHIKDILDETGKSNVWISQKTTHVSNIHKSVKRTLIDQFIQKWHSESNDSNKRKNYYLFKQNMNIESYILKTPRNIATHLFRFRTANFRLPIEVGIWQKADYHLRKCTLCEKNDLGDRFHYIFVCPYFEHERKTYLKRYYYNRPNVIKFNELFNCTSMKVMTNLGKFVKLIMQNFLFI